MQNNVFERNRVRGRHAAWMQIARERGHVLVNGEPTPYPLQLPKNVVVYEESPNSIASDAK